MTGTVLQKFELAINSIKNFIENIEQQEMYVNISQRLERKEITNVEAEEELRRLIIEEFKALPEQFTLDELKEFYNNYEEVFPKIDEDYDKYNIFNIIFTQFIEQRDSQFFADFMLKHDPIDKTIFYSNLFSNIKHHLTEERILQLLLTYKENSETYKLRDLLTSIPITNKILKFIFDNEIEIYLPTDLYNTMIAQASDMSLEEKLQYLQKRNSNLTDTLFELKNDLFASDPRASFFSALLSIIPPNYTLAQILELPILKENLQDSETLSNFLGCYKFKNAESFVKDLTELHLIDKIDSYGFGIILAQQTFNVEDFKKVFLDQRMPFMLAEIIEVYGLAVLNHFPLNEIMEILTDERIFPDGLNESFLVELIRKKITYVSNFDIMLENPILREALISNYYTLSSEIRDYFEFATRTSDDDELVQKILNLVTKENFGKILSTIPSKHFSIDEKYERFLKLAEEIPDLMSSLDFTIFYDETFALGYEFAKLMSMYSNFSSFYRSAIETNNDKSAVSFKEIFPSIWATIERESKEFELNSKEILYSVLSGNTFLLSNFDFGSIQSKDLSKLVYFMIRNASKTSYDIIPNVTNSNDINDYEINLAKMCDEQYLKTSTLEEKINIYFNKYFNMSRLQAQYIYNLFSNSSEDLIPGLKEYIDKIAFALSITKLEVLDELYANEKMYDLKEAFILNSLLKQAYSASLRHGVEEHSPLMAPATDFMYGGKALKIHHPVENFYMLVHSTDAYGKLELLNDNYYDSWNKSSRVRNHGICCSFIANDNLGIAEVRDVLLGFTGWDNGAIPNMAPYDLYTNNDDILITASRPSKFMAYRDLINNTRHSHNEISLERYQNIKAAKAGKIQPSYIIIFEDMSEELKQKAYKAAIEFGVDGEPLPIICLDKKLIAERESQKLDSMIQEFRQTGDVAQLAAIVCKHENNRSGYRITNPEFLEGDKAFFPSEKIITLIEETFNYYSSELSNGNISIQEYWSKVSEILNVLENEEEKFAITNETGHRINNIDLPVREWRNRVERNIIDSLNISLENRVGMIQKFILDAKNDDEVSRIFGMINIDNIVGSIDIVKSQGVYGTLGKNHDFSHIERVLLFADLLATKEKLSDRERELLMVSAAYHDCGRENDTEDKNHAKRSVSKVTGLLENFSETEQKIIKIAIEFHEEKMEFVLDNLCLKAGLSKEETELTKKIAYLLKDADALDRTRFRNAATLNPAYLNTPSSLQLIEFSKKLQRLYRDLPTFVIQQVLVNGNTTLTESAGATIK